MIPRYRGKVTGGRPSGRRRRHRLAILIELFRFGVSLALLYFALVCAIGAGLWLANKLNHDLTDTASSIPVLRQLVIQADLVAGYGQVLLAIGLVVTLALLIVVNFLANLLVEDLIDR